MRYLNTNMIEFLFFLNWQFMQKKKKLFLKLHNDSIFKRQYYLLSPDYLSTESQLFGCFLKILEYKYDWISFFFLIDNSCQKKRKKEEEEVISQIAQWFNIQKTIYLLSPDYLITESQLFGWFFLFLLILIIQHLRFSWFIYFLFET